ncbi:hypothetical protein [Staphylococcus sp. EZ-P03]|uniref:hypothetical protein n=1 Tax=Staphylococcus sp. EZ-P03 TaxID=2282739 RepID=UPI0013C4C9D8|nr:hypothetical protein [Staphylococcus sp. EZ-P03]
MGTNIADILTESNEKFHLSENINSNNHVLNENKRRSVCASPLTHKLVIEFQQHITAC